MAIIVDKDKKRTDIALACKELFVQNAINDLTIATIAKTAGVSKGSIYDYFNNKEDILFLLLTILIKKHNNLKEKSQTQNLAIEEKIKLFFNFFYSDEDKELREIYKSFVAISLTSPNKKITEFQTKCYNSYYIWLEDMIKKAISDKEIIPSSLEFAKSIFYIAEGIYLKSVTTNRINDAKTEINIEIDKLFKLLKVQK